jgi:two-component system, NarL family, response regulator NreC
VSRIDVVLADDHETVRQGLKLLVDGQSDMKVVGEAGDGRSAVARIQELRPHVAVVDISMPGMNGLEATRHIRRVAPQTAIVALTRHDDEAYVQELMAAGVVGYVLKQSSSRELLDAIRAAAHGSQYLDSTLGTRISVAMKRVRATEVPQSRITDRETHVLRLMALGHSNKEIAQALDVSVKTVEVHKANAMRKLGMRGRIDVVRFAVLQGWLKEE